MLHDNRSSHTSTPTVRLCVYSIIGPQRMSRSYPVATTLLKYSESEDTSRGERQVLYRSLPVIRARTSDSTRYLCGLCALPAEGGNLPAGTSSSPRFAAHSQPTKNPCTLSHTTHTHLQFHRLYFVQ